MGVIYTSVLSRFGLAALLLAATAWGCGTDPVLQEDAKLAHFELPSPDPDASIFDLPWPTDLWMKDGFVDVSAFPNPANNDTLSSYIDVIGTHLQGWGLSSAVYFQFSETVDERSLPSRQDASTMSGASVVLVDITEGPTQGAFHPAVVEYVDERTVYWPGHTIAIRPVYGIPLLSGHRYAAVVTREVVPVSGGAFERDAHLEEILETDNISHPRMGEARALYEPAVDILRGAGIDRGDILNLAVFTAQDATGELFSMRDWMMETLPEPAITEIQWEAAGLGFNELSGRYGPAPMFQSGPVPYNSAPDGSFMFEADGTPLVYEQQFLRFSMTIPDGPVPEGGFPVVIYGHGTGGSYRSVVRGGAAEILAREGYATLGFDQVLHGERNPGGGSPEFAFFNFINPFAARDNNRQSALDAVSQARLARNLEVPARAYNRDGEPVSFDAERVYVYGHSQGSLNFPLLLAADDQTQGGMLSGSSGTLAIAILEKKEPVDISVAVRLFLGLPGGTAAAAIEMERFTFEHPVMTLLQTWVDASDTTNYARHIFHDPRPGFAPKSVFTTIGLVDDFTPPSSAEAFAAAAYIPLIEPVARPVRSMELIDLRSTSAPVTGNVADGQATAGAAQFGQGSHFVAQRSPVAERQIQAYFRSFNDGVPTIPSWYE